MRGSLFILILLTLGACAQSIQFDVRCVATPNLGALIIDCADQETWKKWREEQSAMGKR